MPTIRENLLQAIVEIEACPDEVIDLRNWKTETPCGTLYCAVGLLATRPHFMEQGLSWDRRECIQWEDQGLTSMFGKNAFGRLFASRNAALHDHRDATPSTSDKQLVLKRFVRQLEEYPK